MRGYITGLVYAHNNQPYCYDDRERLIPQYSRVDKGEEKYTMAICT